jgi:hypothetical protein
MIRVGTRGAPFNPSGSVDHVAEGGVLEDHPSIVTPRTTKVVRTSWDAVAGCCTHGALVDHVVSAIRGGPTRGGYGAVRRREYANIHTVEPGLASLSEDEVHSPFDVAFGVELSAGLRQNSILVAIEAATIVSLILNEQVRTMMIMQEL